MGSLSMCDTHPQISVTACPSIYPEGDMTRGNMELLTVNFASQMEDFAVKVRTYKRFKISPYVNLGVGIGVGPALKPLDFCESRDISREQCEYLCSSSTDCQGFSYGVDRSD